MTAAFEFKIIRRVEFAETDLAGIVHFSNFFRMMESAEHAFFRSLGFSIHHQGEEGAIGWPRVSASCEYLRPIRFEDEVEIHLLVEEVRSRSIRYRYVFRTVPEGLVVARGKMTSVCTSVDKVTGKFAARAIPEDLRARIATAPAEVLTAAEP